MSVSTGWIAQETGRYIKSNNSTLYGLFAVLVDGQKTSISGRSGSRKLALFLPHSSVHNSGMTSKQAKTGAVTLIQRFGSTLNLNIHFHMLFLEGTISENTWGGTTFTRINTQRAGT